MLENESWVLYDKNKKPLGKTVPRNFKTQENEYHFGVHIWVKSKDKFLIFKRSATKFTFPGYYEMIGGGVNGNDSTIETAVRELFEESGIKADPSELKFMFNIRVDAGEYGIVFAEFDDVFLLERDIDISKIKIEEGKNLDPQFLTKQEVLNLIDTGKFVPLVKAYRDKIVTLF